MAVGDTRFDVEAALRAGITPVGVLTGIGTREDLREAGCQYIFPDLISFAEFIESSKERHTPSRENRCRETADYHSIADTYDIARVLPEKNLEYWVELICQKIGSSEDVDFLDLGCGTGRFSIPISTRLGYRVTGADNSQRMLNKAKRKSGGEEIRWDIQDAQDLSYGNQSYDAVFMSHLLHHTPNPVAVIKECNRVLKSGGILLIRYGAWEHIENDPEHRFFPDVYRIDQARTPTIREVEEWLKNTGFIDVSSQTINQQTNTTGSDRLERVRLKSTSVLTLIDQDSFDQGYKKMCEYVENHPNHDWILIDKITMTTGKTPR
jgi:ubiquinone/menaquinone biosynthesis C-methylase UbiE